MIDPSHPTPAQRICIDPEWTVNETLRSYPGAAAVLNAFGIDACCGGAASLGAAALDAQVEWEALADALAWAAAPALTRTDAP
jgi:iron-sulfur cluster repair protein YtfE (RIC family)